MANRRRHHLLHFLLLLLLLYSSSSSSSSSLSCAYAYETIYRTLFTFALFDEVDEAFCPAFGLICKDIEFFDGVNTSEAMLVDAKDEDDDDDR